MVKKIIKALQKANNRYPLIIFYLLTFAIAFAFYYHVILFSPPQSVHRWRQTDSASMTLNLYQHGMHFFQPEVHNQSSDKGTSGYAAGEAPILYYLIALLYGIFGPHDVIFRIVNVLIFFIGLGALFKIASHFLNNYLASVFVALAVFVSPVMAYYGNNFLTDSTSLALTFIGWWHYIRYLRNHRYGSFLLAIGLLTLAGLLKATATINLLAIAGLALLWFAHFLRPEKKKLFPSFVAAFIPMASGLAIIAAWYLYARWFNSEHLSKTFLTNIMPWWHLSPADRHEITRCIFHDNLPIYFSKGMLTLLLLSLVMMIAFHKQIPRYLIIITGLLLAGGIVYGNLFYIQFVHHDYYLLVLFSPVAFILLSAMVALQSKFPRFFFSWYFGVSLAVLLIINVFHARQEMTLRYFGWKKEGPYFESHMTIKPYLRSIGMKPEDRVISVPDFTNCYSLYLMNQSGYTLRGIRDNTPDTICRLIDLGARYLVINDTSYLSMPEIKPFTKNQVGEYNEVRIFRVEACLNETAEGNNYPE